MAHKSLVVLTEQCRYECGPNNISGVHNNVLVWRSTWIDCPRLAICSEIGLATGIDFEQLAQLSIDHLEDQLTTLAGHLNAANYRLLALIGELERREPWGNFGCKSGAHYLNWKCGIALGAAREKVRTAKALRNLPKVRDACRSGQLSYSKARAITRVATVENETELLDIAFNGTATHVERVVRHYRQIESVINPKEMLPCRSFSGYFDDDGMFVFSGRLTTEQGEQLMKAINIAKEPHDLDADESFQTSRADALVRVTEGFLANEAGESHTADRFQVRISVPSGTLAETELPENDDALELPHGESGQPMSLQTAQRLCCDGSIIPVIEDDDGNPLNIGRKTRTVPASLRRAVDRRDNGCRYPGCTSRQNVDAHHIRHWAHGGETKLSNLISLCRRHHTWLHDGGYQINTNEGRVEFLDAFARVIEPTGDKRSRGNVSEMFDSNTDSGIQINPNTAECNWDGKPANYDHIMFCLFQQQPYVPPDSARD